MSLLSRVLRKRGAFKELARCAVQASTTTHSTLVSTPEPHSIHRRVLPLFDLVPALHEITYVAPNASIVGEVYIDCQVNIWDRAVIRGDLNAVKIHFCSSIKENVCISNVSALPTGLSSATIIDAGCTLVSCNVGTQCYIGPKTVILEGAKIEDEAMVGPNSVVPPGRLIPSHQLWAGNPVRYVRDLTKAEIWAIKVMAMNNYDASKQYSHSTTVESSAHLLKDNKAQENADIHKVHHEGEFHEQSALNRVLK